MNYDYIFSNLYRINHLEIDISVPIQDRIIVFILLRAFNQNIYYLSSGTCIKSELFVASSKNCKGSVQTSSQI